MARSWTADTVAETATTSLDGTELLRVVTDPGGGSTTSKKITTANAATYFMSTVSASASAAASSASAAAASASAAASSAATASTHTASALAAANTAAALASVSAVYQTKAAMDAAASGISANAYVMVLSDENYGNESTIYRKISGTMTFQRVVMGRAGIIDVREFGVVAGSDSTSALETMRAFLAANTGLTVYFPPGAYEYTNNKWSIGVRDVAFLTYGCTFKNNATGGWNGSIQYSTLHLGAGEFTHSSTTGNTINGDGTPYSGISTSSGYLINTVAAGSITVTTTTASDASNFEVGDNVFVHYFSQVAGSYPPNAKFYEYNVVSAVDAGTGAITLRRPTAHGYKSVAPDDTSYNVSCGKARIINLNRTDYQIAGTVKWYGGKTIKYGHGGGLAGYDGAIGVIGATKVEIYDLECAGCFPSMCRDVTFNNCTFTDISEMDKFVETLTFNQCDQKNLTQGTGVQEVFIKGGSIRGDFAQIHARRVFVDGVSIFSQGTTSPQSMIGGSNFHSELWRVENCTFFPNASQKAGVAPGNVLAFTPDSVTATTMVVNSGNAAMTDLKEKLYPGQTITVNTTSGVFDLFRITDLTYDGSNNLTITGYHNVSSPRAASDQRLLWTNQRSIVANNRVVNAPTDWLPTLASRRSWSSCDEDGVYRWVHRHPIAAAVSAASVNGQLVEIVVHVLKPYTGSDSVATFTLSRSTGPGTAWSGAIINLKVAGRRVISGSTSGAQSGDTLNAITAGTWMESLQTLFDGDGTFDFTDKGEDDLPIVRFEVRVASY